MPMFMPMTLPKCDPYIAPAPACKHSHDKNDLLFGKIELINK